MSDNFVREGRLGDAARIAEIYNEGIADRMATFETELRDKDQIAVWFANGYPVIVAGVDNRVMAYAAAFPYRARPCYEGVREFSIYVARDGRGKGFGRAALSSLIEEARRRGLVEARVAHFSREYGKPRDFASRSASGGSAFMKSMAGSTASGAMW